MISFLLLGIIFNICFIFAKIIHLVSSPWTQWTRFKLEVPFYQIFTHFVCLLILCMLSREYASHYVFHQNPSRQCLRGDIYRSHFVNIRSISFWSIESCMFVRPTSFNWNVTGHNQSFFLPTFSIELCALKLLRQSRGGL